MHGSVAAVATIVLFPGMDGEDHGEGWDSGEALDLEVDLVQEGVHEVVPLRDPIADPLTEPQIHRLSTVEAAASLPTLDR